ncbi:MAG TPA: hypothetical protein VGK74_10660 [Symbiobacteriaceae bacterium]|jgi:hypothetical protein
MGITFGIVYSTDPGFRATVAQVAELEANKDEILKKLGFVQASYALPTTEEMNADRPQLYIGMNLEDGIEACFALRIREPHRQDPVTGFWTTQIADNAVLRELGDALCTKLAYASYKW